MFFGMFGSIFLLAQFLQVVQHYSPLQAGLRTLPWTGMPVFVVPITGALSDRIGSRCVASEKATMGPSAAEDRPHAAAATISLAMEGNSYQYCDGEDSGGDPVDRG